MGLWASAESRSIPGPRTSAQSNRWLSLPHPDSGFPEVSLPVVEGGATVEVEVKVKGVVESVPGHSVAFRVIVPLSPQTAVKQPPSPSVVL